MSKIKKNYSINSGAVELLDEIATRLNMRQGDIIAELVAIYGVGFYNDVVTARASDHEALQELGHLADCVRYEIYREEALAECDESAGA